MYILTVLKLLLALKTTVATKSHKCKESTMVAFLSYNTYIYIYIHAQFGPFQVQPLTNVR